MRRRLVFYAVSTLVPRGLSSRYPVFARRHHTPVLCESSPSVTTSPVSAADCYFLVEAGRAIDVQDVTEQVSAESRGRCERACSEAPFGCQALSYRQVHI